MALLTQMSLVGQITYHPPTDEELDQLEIEFFNQQQAAQVEHRVVVDEITARFDFEMGRIRDLVETDSLWAMVQAADIFFGLKDWLYKNTHPQAGDKYLQMNAMRPFPRWFWWFCDELQTWGDYKVDSPWDYVYQKNCRGLLAPDHFWQECEEDEVCFW